MEKFIQSEKSNYNQKEIKNQMNQKQKQKEKLENTRRR